MTQERTSGTFVVKSGLAQMCKGGLIMDVINAEQAKIAEEAGVSEHEQLSEQLNVYTGWQANSFTLC